MNKLKWSIDVLGCQTPSCRYISLVPTYFFIAATSSDSGNLNPVVMREKGQESSGSSVRSSYFWQLHRCSYITWHPGPPTARHTIVPGRNVGRLPSGHLPSGHMKKWTLACVILVLHLNITQILFITYDIMIAFFVRKNMLSVICFSILLNFVTHKHCQLPF